MALNALVLTEEGKETYVVDCGSTCHMIRKNNPQMVILETTSSSSVGFADGSQIHSSGTCKIEFRDNRPFDLKEALIVPIDYNLLSTHVLARECGSLTILGVTGGYIWGIEGVVRRLHLRNGLYVFTQDTKTPQRALLSNSYMKLNTKDQWMHEHLRLGHMAAEKMSRLLNVPRAKIPSFECEGCCKGRMTIKPHRRRRKIDRRLHTVHTDTVFAGTTGFSGEKYFLVTVDEYSSYVWISLLRSKSEAAQNLVNILKIEQKRVHLDVMKLRRDGGTELIGVRTFLEEEGIIDHPSIRYDHDGNGLVEGMNRIITEHARAMIYSSGLPMYFWTMAVQYAATIHNNSYHGNDLLTPSEKLYGKIQVEHRKFLIFGTCVEVHVPSEIRNNGKFAEVSQSGVFLGVDPDGYAFKVLVSGGLQRTRTLKDSGRFWTSTELNEVFSLEEDSEFEDEGIWTAEEHEELRHRPDEIERESDEEKEDQSRVRRESTSPSPRGSSPQSRVRRESTSPPPRGSSPPPQRRPTRESARTAKRRIKQCAKLINLQVCFSTLSSISMDGSSFQEESMAPEEPRNVTEALRSAGWKESMIKE